MADATKAAVALASEHDLDLADLATGNGRKGRITVRDVRAYLNSARADPSQFDPRGRRIWEDVKGHLEHRDLWQPVYGELLASYVRSVIGAADARARIERDGTTTLGSQGQLVVHPEVKIRRDYELDALRYATALCITPEAVQKHRSEAAEDDTDLGF